MVEEHKRVQHYVTSKPFIVKKVEVNRENSNYGSSMDPKISKIGTEFAGYVVFLKYDGEILDQKASAKVYLSEEWINRL